MQFGGSTTKGRTFPVEVLTAEEVRALMKATSRRGSCGVRDRALIAMLYRSGLRISEMLDLQPKDVDSIDGVVRVLHGKGDRQRVVAVDDETLALLGLWMIRRIKLRLSGAHPLFCTLAGGRMKAHQFRERLKVLAGIAGIDKRVHPHGLRHSLASSMVEQGVPLPTIQMALGHASLQTTQTYVNHVRPAAVIEAMRELKW